MKWITRISFCGLFFLQAALQTVQANGVKDNLQLFEADNPMFHYVGRIDFRDAKKPRFWSPGVYIKAKFSPKNTSFLPISTLQNMVMAGRVMKTGRM